MNRCWDNPLRHRQPCTERRSSTDSFRDGCSNLTMQCSLKIVPPLDGHLVSGFWYMYSSFHE